MDATTDLASALRRPDPPRVVGGVVVEQVDTTHARCDIGDKAVLAYAPGGLPVGASVRLLVGGGVCEVITASTPWIAPTLTNSWVDFLAGVAPVGYLLHLGEVSLRGAIKSGTVAVPAFTLPLGFRPTAGNEIFYVVAGPGGARLDVGTDGTVVVRDYRSAGTNAMVTLSGIRFRIS